MKIELYVKNNDFVGRVIDKDKIKRVKRRDAWEFIKEISADEITNFQLKDGVINFNLNKIAVEIKDYKKIRYSDYFSEINSLIKKNSYNKKIRIIKSKKANRNRSIAVGAAVVIIGVPLFLSNVFAKEEAKDFKFALPQPTGISTELTTNTVSNDIVEKPVVEDDTCYVNINYDNRSNTEKAIFTREKYGEIITKYANMYGIDPDLMIAVATQESGVHTEYTGGSGATGLMQIENEIWINNSVTAFNYETGEKDTIYITEENIDDLDINIQTGCMIMQQSLKYMDNNPIAGIECYNKGYGNMDTIINGYANECGITKEEVLTNTEDIGWLEYRNTISAGDPNYIENVLSWYGENISINFKDENGNDQVINISPSKENVNMPSL